jgi:hypothetical protein
VLGSSLLSTVTSSSVGKISVHGITKAIRGLWSLGVPMELERSFASNLPEKALIYV